jgi:DNA-binding response OmpR family regulator
VLGWGRAWGYAESGVKRDSDSAASKILVIDDEADFRQVIIRFLSRQGFTVVAASDGKAGVGLAGETLPDLIVCDLNMPGMDGYEVLAALRLDPKVADIPLIFLTAQSQPSQVRQGMSLGADDYLTKPVSLDDLLGAIQARLKRRQSERQRQEKQMERAMRLFGETVHDLRNPLFAIFGYTNQLKNAAASPDHSQERADQAFAGLQQAVTRMQDIISETMHVVRSQMKRLPLNAGAFDLRDFCELLLADHEPEGRLQFRCGEGPFPVVADGPRLRHALENLLSNGLKYSVGPVMVSLTKVAQGYHIEVSDQGVGIPVEDQASIFEPFFRASNTAGRTGHGLGLCVAKSCLEEHGGSIHFVSKPEQGTTFLVHLPASPPGYVERQGGASDARITAQRLPAPRSNIGADGDSFMYLENQVAPLPRRITQSQPPPPEPKPSQSQLDAKTRPFEALPENAAKLRAIVIEDDPVVRNVVRELLESSNDVQVLGEAGTVAEARLLAREQKPAVVFLDVNLADGSGFDLLPALEPNVSVVFVTSAEEYASQAFDCEATDYLVKPVTSERMQKALLRVRQRLMAKTQAAWPPDSRLTGSFLVKTLTEKRLVKISEIKSVIAYGEYSWVYWDRSKKGALLRKSLKQWQSELPRDQFIRVHRRAIVNLAFMDRVERLPAGRLQIHLCDTPEPILVSLSQTAVVNRRLEALRG